MNDTLERGAALRILVVDNCEDAAESLALLLEIWGHRATTAFEALSGLTAFDLHRPDVVIADIAMPGISGTTMAYRLRERPGGTRAFLIAHSGLTDERRRREVFKAGFDQFIAKPADPAALERLLIGVREYVWLVAALRERGLGGPIRVNERTPQCSPRYPKWK